MPVRTQDPQGSRLRHVGRDVPSVTMLSYWTLLVSHGDWKAADGHGIIILLRNIMFWGKSTLARGGKIFSMWGTFVISSLAP